MKKILCALPKLVLTLALAGCCANDVCMCNDQFADALYFRFDYNSLGTNSFTASDIDTVMLYRTNIINPNPVKVGATVSTTDSVLITRPIVSGIIRQDELVINNAAPFASAGGTIKLTAYTYRIVVRPNRKRKYTYQVSNIKLTGQYKADGCCTCYENTSKQFDLTANGVSTTQVVTESMGQRKVVPLTRYP